MDMSDTPTRGGHIALLIDGENVPFAHAATVLRLARQRGDPVVRRVYGDARHLTTWQTSGGLLAVHTGTGKNATDMRLAIEAVDLAHRGGLSGFVIASSDSDFAHLVHFLRERQFAVTGIGETKTPAAFRLACSAFEELATAPPVDAASDGGTLDRRDRQLRHLLVHAPDRPFDILRLGTAMRDRFGEGCADLPQANWRAYLEARPSLYRITGSGKETRVEWAGPRTNQVASAALMGRT